MIRNLLFNSRPLVVHAQGSHELKPHWRPIRDAFFSAPSRHLTAPKDLTIITCNNGHEAMGILERSLAHLGLSCLVRGQGIHPWINSQHKPQVLAEALREIQTPYTLYADSRDAILLDDPSVLVQRFEQSFKAELVFGADRMSWPPIREFKKFEDALPEAGDSEFRYLNGGAWIGRTEFCREFFEEAARTPPLPEVPDSEQGILRKLFMHHHPRVQLDYRCELFMNIGFVLAPIIALEE